MDATHPIWSTPAVIDAATAGRYGALIRMTRIARELTLVQAGLLCHLSASVMSRIETGKRPLTDIDQLRQISTKLGIPPELFGLADPMPGAALGDGNQPADMVSANSAGEHDEESMRRRHLLAGATGASVLGLLSTYQLGTRPSPSAISPLACPQREPCSRHAATTNSPRPCPG